MKLEERGMRRREFKRLIRTKLIERHAALNGFCGVAGVLEILEISEKWTINSAGVPVTIAEAGYRWLQLAPDSGEWWLTAMYDTQGCIVQYYFDIVRDIYISRDCELRFTDLFLDIVMKCDGTLILMDRDELDSAYADGLIDSALYNRALRTAERLIRRLEGNEPALRSFCGEVLRMICNENTEAGK